MTKPPPYAPRKMRANNKPTQCMPPVCAKCLRTSAGKTKTVHGDEPCPIEAKIEAARVKLAAERAAEGEQSLKFVGEVQP